MDPLFIISNLAKDEHSAIEAWHYFLDHYTGLILRVIRRYETDYDQIMNRYLQVCDHLCDNEFRQLKKFTENNKPVNETSFPLWLAVTVRNRCIDLHRRDNGRPRLPKIIQAMTPRDHEVYKMYLWKGLSPYEIDERIQPETNGDHRSGIEILKDLEAAMLYHNQKMPTPQPSNRMVSLNGIYASTLNIETNEISENPDWMNKALKNLSDEQQLVLKLRFWDDIPPKDIARVLNIKPPSKVYCILKKGLDQIRVYHNKFKLQQGL